MQTSYKIEIDGMHCKACEKLIAKTIRDKYSVSDLHSNHVTGVVRFTSKDEIDYRYIDKKIKPFGYTIKQETYAAEDSGNKNFKIKITKSSIYAFLISFFIITVLKLLESLSIYNPSNIYNEKNFISFFVYGLIAGISSCAALTGMTLLSLTKFWSEDSTIVNKSYPYILFILGRIFSYTFIGLIIGFIGRNIGVDTFGSDYSFIVNMIAALLMLFIGLEILGFKLFAKFIPHTPDSISNIAIKYKDTGNSFGSFIIGALTILFPCGFTMTVFIISLSAANPIEASSIMFAFVLGTIPSLLLITFISQKYSNAYKTKVLFNKIVGILVIFFSLNLISNQLGLFNFQEQLINDKKNSQIIDGYQIINIEVKGNGYFPSIVYAQSNLPIKLIVNNIDGNGCTERIISNELFGNKQIPLDKGENIIDIGKLQKGEYKYSCWMRMYWGKIVVE